MTLIAKLLTTRSCVNTRRRILWNKVIEDPVLTQHVLLHIIQCCNDARFLPEEVVVMEKELTPIALAFCAQLVVPLKSKPAKNMATLFLSHALPSRKNTTTRLYVGFLP